MALVQMQNDEAAFKKWLPPELQRLRDEYLASAIDQLRSAEISENFDNLEAILEGKAYIEMSSSASEGGYPSPSAFMAMAPDLRKTRLAKLSQSAKGLEFSMLTFLGNIAEEDPDRALDLIDDLSRSASGNFKAKLHDVAAIAKKIQADNEKTKRSDLSVLRNMSDPPDAQKVAKGQKAVGPLKKMVSPSIVSGPEPVKPKGHQRQRKKLREVVAGAEPEGDKINIGPGD